jgi:hypothetical protein
LSQGAIFLHREITDHWLWKDKPFSKGQAWVDMILLANHTENKVPYNDKVTIISRGEFIRSERFLAMRWGWSKASVHRFLILLKNDSMIDIKSNQKANQISILNYNEYQEIRTKKEPKVNQKRTSSEPVVNLNNNEEECIKNDKNIYRTSVKLLKTEYDSLIADYGERQISDIIDDLENYIVNTKKGKDPYQEHNLTLRSWLRKKGAKINGKEDINTGNSEGHINVFGEYLAKKYQ